MKVLLKQAKIYDRNSGHHLKRRDVLIKDGVISAIDQKINDKGAKELTSKNLCVSPGWMDIGAFNGEPGYEHREDLESLKNAAAAGGYTYIAPMPNTHPVGDNKAMIKLLLDRNSEHVVEIMPLAAASANAEGIQLAEIYDLRSAGSIAFCDGPYFRQSMGQLIRTLEYINGLQSRFITGLISEEFNSNGQMNEGQMSTQLGMVGMPKVEEEINAFTLAKLAEYTNCPIHLHNLTVGSVVRQLSSNRSLPVTFSVPYLNLIFDDSDLKDFNVQLKTWPPLREKQETRDLIKLIQGGKISVINSNHFPMSPEEKDLEFGQTAFGATGLETCFRALLTHASGLETDIIVDCLSQGAYAVLGIEAPVIEEESKAVLTIFDPDDEGYLISGFRSKSSNNPFIDQQLKGRIIGIINHNKFSHNKT